jgi:hypothetical protein
MKVAILSSPQPVEIPKYTTRVTVTIHELLPACIQEQVEAEIESDIDKLSFCDAEMAAEIRRVIEQKLEPHLSKALETLYEGASLTEATKILEANGWVLKTHQTVFRGPYETWIQKDAEEIRVYKGEGEFTLALWKEFSPLHGHKESLQEAESILAAAPKTLYKLSLYNLNPSEGMELVTVFESLSKEALLDAKQAHPHDRFKLREFTLANSTVREWAYSDNKPFWYIDVTETEISDTGWLAESPFCAIL